eukprot:Pgem_evm1s17807
MTQLSRDLRHEFYVYFDKVFPVLVLLLEDYQDVEAIQCTFTTLSYLFKFLSKNILTDLEVHL